jgi:hypothetical protein
MNNKTETALAVKSEGKTNALTLMAQRLSVDPDKLMNTLKATVFKGATNEELLTLVAVSQKYNLDPLTRQIFGFPSRGGIVPVVSVDGWLHILNSHPQFDGLEFEYQDDEKGDPITCTAIVYRKDRSKPIRVTEYFSECVRPTEPWKMKHRMLRHKACKEVARVAFGVSGITDVDEAQDMARNSAEKVTIVSKPLFKKALPAPSPVEDEPLPEMREDAMMAQDIEWNEEVQS